MNKDRKSTVKKNVFAAIVFALLVALIGGTYARYVSTASGSGNVNIAKWAVKVNNTDITTAAGTFDLTFEADNADTVPGKVAPNGTAEAYVDVDLTGTEVSVEFECKLADEAAANLSAVFGADYANKINVEVGAPAIEGDTSNMTLDAANKAITVGTAAMSGKVRVPITLTWENDEANNVADTLTGANQTSVTLPVTLTVKQKI